MMKLDFSGVKDARVGDKEVQRIYRGDTRVWNRYCWEKWSCSKIVINSMGTESTGETVTVKPTSETGSLSMYKTRKGYLDSGGYYAFSGKIATNTYTFGEAYDKGYVYATNGDKVFTGERFLKMTGYTYEGTEKMLVFKEYRVLKSSGSGGYMKGSTSYGIGEGSAGDYPDNGRHSDGYWYVRVGPVGVKEE